MTEPEAQARFRQWLQEIGSAAEFDLSKFASTQVRDDVWVFTPPGRTNSIYVVTPAVVRTVHPSKESLPAVLAEMGIEV